MNERAYGDLPLSGAEWRGPGNAAGKPWETYWKHTGNIRAPFLTVLWRAPQHSSGPHVFERLIA